MNQTIPNALEILNRHIPGFHQYALSEPVRLLYASQSLCDLLGLPKTELGTPCMCIRRTGTATRRFCKN